MAHLFIFGLGYTAKRIRAALEVRGWRVTASGADGEVRFDDEPAVRAELASASHVLSSVPPVAGSDPVLDCYGEVLGHAWLGYLSSTGVYGDTNGAWVDESAPIGGGRRAERAQCDATWMARGAHVFRLPGIYGPGRSALNRVAGGQARRIAVPKDGPDQVFSRVHVEDIASAVIAGLEAPPGAYNLADDLPCSQNQVIGEACRLLGMAPPPMQTLDQAGLSPAARAFYSENRRIANGKARRVLGWRPAFPDYRSGLYEIWRGG